MLSVGWMNGTILPLKRYVPASSSSYYFYCVFVGQMASKFIGVARVPV